MTDTIREFIARQDTAETRRKLLRTMIERMSDHGDSPEEIAEWVANYIEEQLLCAVSMMVAVNRMKNTDG